MLAKAQSSFELGKSYSLAKIDRSKNCCLTSWKTFRAFMKEPSTYPYFLLCLIFMFLNADQNLISPNLTAISENFNLTLTQGDTIIGGDLNLAFFIVGGISTLLVGYFVDRMDRKKLLLWVVLIGEIGCFCTIFVSTLPEFFFTRALTGISFGGVSKFIFFICTANKRL